MAPSTIGTFLRSFTFGHVRQLDAVLSRTLARAWELGAGPGDRDLVVDLDSTICEVHGKHKHGAGYGYTKCFGYHPLLATRADTGEILGARMRKGAAGSPRGVVQFVGELTANLKRAGATGKTTVRADSAFWSWKLIDRLNAHNIAWSIGVRQVKAIQRTIATIDEADWTPIVYPDGEAQVAETIYETGKGARARTVRLVVRRTRLAEGSQRRLWPDWRHHAFITNIESHTTIGADQFHRNHARVELVIRDLKEGAGLEHVPSGSFPANGAWLACAVLAHNLTHWTANLGGLPPATNRTRHRCLFALAATLVNRSGKRTLRFPTDWPYAQQFTQTLAALRALPALSG